MERLWAPWRGEYIADTVRGKDPSAQACVFCTLFADLVVPDVELEASAHAKQAADKAGLADITDAKERLLLYRDAHVAVVMNRFPYNNGHLLVLPLVHGGRLDGLCASTFSRLHGVMAACVGVLEQALSCHGLNLGMNMGRVAGAGIPDHLHYHVLPRWNGDSNFLPLLAETKTISQHIEQTYDLLRPGFDQLVGRFS